MATTTTKKNLDFTDGFGDAAERYRAVNEKLLETGKKTANAALDGYEKTIASYVDFRQQLAEATPLDWITTAVKAQIEFLSEVNAAYISAARDLLKGYNEDEPPARVEGPSGDDIDSHAADRAAGYEDELEDDEDLEDDDTNQESQESDVQEDVHNEPAEDADVEEEPEKDTNGDDESEVTDLKPRNQRARGPKKAPARRKATKA